jgi:hypothetical protein
VKVAGSVSRLGPKSACWKLCAVLSGNLRLLGEWGPARVSCRATLYESRVIRPKEIASDFPESDLGDGTSAAARQGDANDSVLYHSLSRRGSSHVFYNPPTRSSNRWAMSRKHYGTSSSVPVAEGSHVPRTAANLERGAIGLSGAARDRRYALFGQAQNIHKMLLHLLRIRAPLIEFVGHAPKKDLA